MFKENRTLNNCIIYITVVAVAALIAVIVVKRRHQRILLALSQIEKDADKASAEIGHLYGYGHYITESERLELLDKYASLYNLLRLVKGSGELKTAPQKELFYHLFKVLSESDEYKKQNNQLFIDNQLQRHSEFFDSVLPYPLDWQQRDAIVSLEDNVLVISSAGSGKTMTTVGKVRYLIDKQGIAPEKILLVTFTRKAAESLSQRLGEKDLKCVTFHKLALDIIAETTGKRPSIVPADFSLQVFRKLRQDDGSFRLAVTDFLLRSRYKMNDQFEYDTIETYMRERKRYGVQAYFKDMDGRTVFCKSDEESQICDYLGSRGILFRYEEKYEQPTADINHRQYRPDFSIYHQCEDGTLQRIYLEHFAVNEHGHCPKWFGEDGERNYLSGVEWKRSVHLRYGTVLIETSSADFHRGDVFEKLGRQLESCGIEADMNKTAGVTCRLEKLEQNVLDMLSSFNFLLKSKGMTVDELMAEGNVGSQDKVSIRQIVVPFLKAYKKKLSEEDMIDFMDIIIEATSICNNGNRPDYDYILVDEFQDISLDRYRFLQSLRRDKPLTKLFCVGDDWQSIYRFAGSDMALFKDFSKFFGFTKECRMETTYRFGNPLIEQSSKFILANPVQKKKEIRPFSNDARTRIVFVPSESRMDMADRLKNIVANIPAAQSIYLLGRYSFDVNLLKDNGFDVHEVNGKVSVCYGNREMTFMTVHKSKGLESDYVILLNCNSGFLGFPADVADNPVLKYVLSEQDGYSFSEERRVFYVAITRARVQTFVLYDKNRPSQFVSEFVEGIDGKQNEESIPESELCPKCKCGRLQTVYRGVAVNGNPYSVIRCSNEKLGCDYGVTKFTNLV